MRNPSETLQNHVGSHKKIVLFLAHATTI